ncbi:GNAT family N-acetyltransferase [Sphaerisporangium siamense]|uniref:GNAT superfamily N-acetyltransferase n=1 Tax=Sphaerisporangium siamense TaxID=795645 RepID=A0A7W7DDK3_9ACTN|nr:GNAT family N-acetyltransferase [Sphaerisporangium siamense]MBB4704584.1 GNAT superfamily N-acetyltransferase [Sphaerisporangium siamense]
MDIRTEPPYNAGPLYQRQRYTDRTSKQVASEGFALVSARDRAGALAGFAFGFRMPAGRWWGGNTTPVAELVDVDKFAVIELNLRKEYRGKGYGRKLLEELLAARPEQWAMLLSLPAAPAHAMYEHLGWEVVGTVQPAPDAEVADVMVLPLHVEGASAGA